MVEDQRQLAQLLTGLPSRLIAIPAPRSPDGGQSQPRRPAALARLDFRGLATPPERYRIARGVAATHRADVGLFYAHTGGNVMVGDALAKQIEDRRDLARSFATPAATY